MNKIYLGTWALQVKLDYIRQVSPFLGVMSLTGF